MYIPQWFLSECYWFNMINKYICSELSERQSSQSDGRPNWHQPHRAEFQRTLKQAGTGMIMALCFYSGNITSLTWKSMSETVQFKAVYKSGFIMYDISCTSRWTYRRFHAIVSQLKISLFWVIYIIQKPRYCCVGRRKLVTLHALFGN